MLNPPIIKFIRATALSVFLVASTLPFSSYEWNEAGDPSVVFFTESIEAASLYENMNLAQYGLSCHAFELALKGMNKLERNQKLSNPYIITIADFTQSSNNKRLYIIDLFHEQLLFQTFVAHGENTGDEFAQLFSNRYNSHQSSLGFYITLNAYDGDNGISLRINGMEPGFNTNAFGRDVVIHGADYVSEQWIADNGYLGRSFGCPAVPMNLAPEIIEIIKEGSCLFVYSDNAYYLKKSAVLSGN